MNAPEPASGPTVAGPTVARPTVALVGALDTKADEYGFVRSRLAAAGVDSVMIDIGVLGIARGSSDIDRDAVARAAGSTVEDLARAADRNVAMTVMARGASLVVRDLIGRGGLSGLLVLGGSNAGYVMSRLAPEFPLGVPKVLVSTIVAGDTRPYVGTSDLTMIYPVVDLAGLNSVSSVVLARAADALAGMVQGTARSPLPATTHPTVGCSMFGVTTACVAAVVDELEATGTEVHTFHANGTGGRGLEALIRSGSFSAVADITTTELADELFGGVCSAGPDRLTAAADRGVPQVVSVGALDMVNFGARETVPERYADRRLMAHNPMVTLMRTSADECALLGRVLAEKVNRSTAFAEVHVPRRGFSQISEKGGRFYDPEADRALIDALAATLSERIPLIVHDAAINDRLFADEISQALFRAIHT